MRNSQGDGEALERKIAQSTIDINAYDSKGYTLLHYAAQFGYDDCLYVQVRRDAESAHTCILSKTLFIVG